MRIAGFGLLLSVALLVAGSASGASLGSFTCITGNSATDCAIGEAQLSADLTGNVLTITMNGAAAGVVKQVFVASGATGGSFGGSTAGGVVAFVPASTPGQLPGARRVGFDPSVSFRSFNAAPLYGIGTHRRDPAPMQAGQFVLSGGDLSNLAVGVHVIGFNGGGSEAFVLRSPVIPEPSSVLLFGLGGIAVFAWVRRSQPLGLTSR